MTISKGDFIYLDFVGKIEETGEVFDTTREDIAKKAGLQQGKMDFEPLLICVGEEFILPALEKELEGKKEDASFTVKLQPEQAFGKKRADHLKLMPMKAFKKQDVKPHPGLTVSVDNVQGVVKSVTGNRVIVDFNHPLSGRPLVYDLEIKGKEESLEKQVQAVVGRTLGFAPEITVEDGVAKATMPVDMPEEARKSVTEAVTRMTSAKDLEFSVSERT